MAAVFSAYKFGTGGHYRFVTEIMILTIILLFSGFVGFFHYHKKSILYFPGKQQMIREVSSLKEKILFDAVNTGNELLAAAALALGAAPDLKDKTGDYLLHIAAKRDYRRVIVPLIQFGADINISNKLQKRPLHIAASNMNYKILKLLIDAGAKLNVKDMHGKTPLHRLCSHSRYTIKNMEEFIKWVKIIIHLGVDPLASDKYGVSTYDLSIKWDLKEIVHFIETTRRFSIKENKNDRLETVSQL